MKLELISFKICPFVQRAVITLLHNKVEHEVSYIDLASPPQWFSDLSPFGKVPILKVDGKHVIFESAIIDEFLNDTFNGQLLPTNSLERAMDRSWIDFGSNLLLDFSGLIHANDANNFNSKLKLIKQELDWLERKLGDGPYFNGKTFSLVDIAYAPLFMRTNLLKLSDSLYPRDNYPKINTWENKLLEIPVLKDSVVNNFFEIFTDHIKNKAPFAAKQFNI